MWFIIQALLCMWVPFYLVKCALEMWHLDQADILFSSVLWKAKIMKVCNHLKKPLCSLSAQGTRNLQMLFTYFDRKRHITHWRDSSGVKRVYWYSVTERQRLNKTRRLNGGKEWKRKLKIGIWEMMTNTKDLLKNYIKPTSVEAS